MITKTKDQLVFVQYSRYKAMSVAVLSKEKGNSSKNTTDISYVINVSNTLKNISHLRCGPLYIYIYIYVIVLL